MKILLTGANGYLGQGICKSLLDLGLEVIACDFSTDRVDPRASTVQCNLFLQENPYEYFGAPDAILHLAWRDGFKHNSDAHLNDLPLHYAFLEKMVLSGCKRVAAIGTMHEIGYHEGSINENTPCNPLNLYGIAKNALRRSLEVLVKNKPVTLLWLRGFYIVGNSEYGDSVFSKITSAEKDGKDTFPFTTGDNQYDFIDYPVFCEQVSRAVNQDKVTGIINICSGRPEKLRDRAEKFITENNYKIELKYGMYPDRPYDSPAVWGDNKKIQSILSASRGMG